MFDRSSQARHKNAVRVRLALAGSPAVDAWVFLKLDERLIDLLNDPRAFIPIRRDDGAMMIVAKSSIISIIESAAEEAKPAAAPTEEIPKEEAPQAEQTAGAKPEREERRPRGRRTFDPYEVLRIDRSATIEEIKRAYKARIKAVHPDTLAALEVDEEITRAAHLSTQKVNQAYDRIMRERQLSEEQKASAAG